MNTKTATREPRFSSLVNLFGQALGFDAHPHSGVQKSHACLSSDNGSTYVRGSTVTVQLSGGRWKQLPLEVKVLSRSPARGTLGGRKVDAITFHIRDVSSDGAIKWRVTQIVPRNQHKFQLVVDGDREADLKFTLQDIKKS